MDLSANELKRVNDKRVGTQYMDEESAVKSLDSPFKNKLPGNTPFYYRFEYGANKDGYWN